MPHYKSRSDHREAPAFSIFYYGFNVTQPPFDDPLVRRAFAHSIDRKQVATILQGGQIPWPGWIPPGMIAADENVGCRFDPELAKKILEQAGYKSPEDLSEVALAYNTNLPNTMVSSNIQAQWSTNLGVDVRLDNMEWKVYLRLLRDEPPQIFRLGWVSDYPDPDNFMKVFTSTSGNNHTKWKNPAYDRLVEAAALELDTAKRKKLYEEAQRILLVKDCAIVPIFAGKIHRLVSPRLSGFKLNPMDLIFFDRLSFNETVERNR